MSNKHVASLPIALAVLITFSTGIFFSPSSGIAADAPAAKKTEAPAPAAATPALPAIDVDAAMKDRVIGKEDAPVTIIEYASMTCPHCAHFETKILPELKKRLLDTGKAKLIFRDFPLDKFALKAAMMTRCASPEKYFNLADVVFSNQERWAKSADPLSSLAQLGALAGMDETLFKACTENKDLETAILKNMQDAQGKYRIQSTPTFIFNDGLDTLSGALEIEKFEEVIKKLPTKVK